MLTYQGLVEEGTLVKDLPFRETQPDDIYIMCYTSGTTGDSKGAKLTHKNLFCSIKGVSDITPAHHDDVHLSFLPYAHCFEQSMSVHLITSGCAIGYYHGDPLKLIEDCQALRPTVFATVPRVYNKIHAAIKARMDEATGCKRLLLDWAFNSKRDLASRAVYTHGCYDALIFKKVK